MLRSLLFLCAVITFVSSTASAHVRRRRTIYKVGPAEDPKEAKQPSVYLKLTPGFFDYPGLKDIYTALEGGKIPQEDIHFQIAPRKREAERNAAFALRINPVVPRNPMSVRDYNNTACQENKRNWCIELPPSTPKMCRPVDTPTPIPTTCGPRKPKGSLKMYPYCNLDNVNPHVPKESCDECPPQIETTTQYIACYSMPPPTAAQRLKYCNPTTLPCHNEPCTYKVGNEYSPAPPPPSPPPCDAALSGHKHFDSTAELKPSQKYYILVKRSPGGWAAARRKRDSRQKKRRFRIVPDLQGR